MKMINKIIILLILSIIFFPLTGNAQPQNDEIFKATVLEIMEEKLISDDFRDTLTLQKLKLKALEGSWENQEIEFDGTLYEAVGANQYEIGDKVLVTATINSEGEKIFYVTDYIRNQSLYWLAIIFAIVVIAIGRLKGVRALIVLCITFFIILKFILPQILNGHSPLLISIIGSLFILIIAIYLTEGFKRNSTISVVAITISLLITGVISILFTNFAKLTGGGNDDIFFLKELNNPIKIKNPRDAGNIVNNIARKLKKQLVARLLKEKASGR